MKRLLGELKGAPLLHGVRGTPPADLDALAGVITAIADAALSLGSALRTLEVNPLRVAGTQIEALDVLVVTGPGTLTSNEEDEVSRPVLTPTDEHPITIAPTDGRVVVRVGGTVVADSATR